MAKAKKHLLLSVVVLLSLTALPVVSNGQTPGVAPKSRLVVSFYSICCGIDNKAQDKFDRFVSNYERAHRKQLREGKVHWGREGEIDYCLPLSELSRREQQRFIANVRSLLRRSRLVHISENEVCKTGR
jgi:hypothetical protein